MTPADPAGGDPSPNGELPHVEPLTRSLPPPPLYEASDEISLEDPEVEATDEVDSGVSADSDARFTGPEPSRTPTPQGQRIGRPFRVGWMWFGANASLFGVVVGGLLFSIGMGLAQAVLAAVIGTAIAGTVLGIGTAGGARTGLPGASVDSEGVAARLAAGVLLIARVGAGATLLALVARSVGDLLGSEPAALAVLAVTTAATGALAGIGYRALVPALRISSVAGAAFVVVFALATVGRIDLRVAATIGAGPPVLVVAGAVIVVSLVSGYWLLSGDDLGRYQRTRSGSPLGTGAASAIWAVIGAVVPTVVIVAYGAVLVASDPGTAQEFRAAPVAAMAGTLPAWYTLPFVASIVIGATVAVALATYSATFAMLSVARSLRRPLAGVVVAAAAGLLAAALVIAGVGLDDLVRDVATSIAVPVVAWAGIRSARTLRSRSARPFGVRPRDLILLVVAIAIGFGLLGASLPGLQWQGYLYALSSASVDDAVVSSDLGVLVAFTVGLVGAAMFRDTDRRRGAGGSHRGGPARGRTADKPPPAES